MPLLVEFDSYDEQQSLQGQIAGRCSISQRLEPIKMNDGEAERTLWHLFHRCLSVYKIHVLCLRSRVFQKVLSLLERLDKGM